MTREIIRVNKDTRQTTVDVVREYPTGMLRYDDTTYATPVYHQICADGKVAGMFIRQELVQTIHKLTDGAREVPVSQLRTDVLPYVEVK